MMVISCAVFQCPNNEISNNDLPFHSFPRDRRRLAWIEACRREELRNKSIYQMKDMYICGIHFEEHMYDKNILRPTAVPTLHIPKWPTYSVYTQTTKHILISQGTQTGQFTPSEKRIEPEIYTITSNVEAVDPLQMPDDISRKRIKTEPFEHVIKPTRYLSEEDQRFLEECDKRLPPKLSEIVKLYVNVKHMS